MEGRVAEGHVEALIDADQALEYLPAIRLPAQLDGSGEAWVGGEDRSGRGQRLRVDVGADEAPAVFVVAEQRVDAVGAGADIEHPDRGATRDDAGVIGGQQVGQAVQFERLAADHVEQARAIAFRAVEQGERRRPFEQALQQRCGQGVHSSTSSVVTTIAQRLAA
ncbi:hypothetical protein WAI10_20090, partial [Acinetobacter baumannii]